MDWVPLNFIDDVCHQLEHEAFQQVSELSDTWSPFGAEHREKRREFVFSCRVDGQKISYSFKDWKNKTSMRVAVADVNSKFDRITSVNIFDSTDPLTNWDSLNELKHNVLPTVASLVANCYWSCMTGDAHNQIFFEAFKNCPGIKNISVKEQGQESRDFIARQVELGNVQKLYLYARQSVEWPEPEKLAETIKTFVNSERFDDLIYQDVNMSELFLESVYSGELKPNRRVAIKDMNGTSLMKVRRSAI